MRTSVMSAWSKTPGLVSHSVQVASTFLGHLLSNKVALPLKWRWLWDKRAVKSSPFWRRINSLHLPQGVGPWTGGGHFHRPSLCRSGNCKTCSLVTCLHSADLPGALSSPGRVRKAQWTWPVSLIWKVSISCFERGTPHHLAMDCFGVPKAFFSFFFFF